MARPKIEKEELTEVKPPQVKSNVTEKLADAGVFFLFDKKNNKRVKFTNIESAKHVLIHNPNRYEAREASEFWNNELTSAEKAYMNKNEEKNNLRVAEINVANLRK